MLLAYDGTLQEDYNDETQRAIYNQSSSNMHAVVAAKALGRLGGYMFDELASPPNEHLQTSLARLLTPSLSKQLRNRRPWEILSALNENVEKATKIWNVGMRKELLDFVHKTDQNRPPGSRENDLEPALEFTFSALRDELCIGDVYVRIFIKTGDTADIEDPTVFCKKVLEFVGSFMSLSGDSRRTVSQDHQEYAIEALRSLAATHDYIAYDIANAPHGLHVVFSLLTLPSESAAFESAARLMAIVCAAPDFITAAVKDSPPVLWRLLCGLCTAGGPHMSHLWAAAEGMAAHPEGLDALINCGAVPHLLGVIFGVAGYFKEFQNRLSAIALLSKFLWNPVKGSDASAMLRRFVEEVPQLNLLYPT